jgi:hypothetical protein
LRWRDQNEEEREWWPLLGGNLHVIWRGRAELCACCTYVLAELSADRSHGLVQGGGVHHDLGEWRGERAGKEGEWGGGERVYRERQTKRGKETHTTQSIK